MICTRLLCGFLLLAFIFGFTYANGGVYEDLELNNFGAVNCSLYNDDCDKCSDAKECFWCKSSSLCSDKLTMVNNTCSDGWCEGEACECSSSCTEDIFPCSDNVVGIILLLFFYGIILACGAKFISDGSELLLEILDPGIIGGLLIPVLGAVPDAAIVVVSGALGSASSAQKNLSVGVGTLAGSTIMLLTIPWSFALFLARTDIKSGESIDSRRTKKYSLTESGTTVDKDTQNGALIMLCTAVSYIIGQGVAFAYLGDPSGDSAKKVERWFALVGMITCGALLLMYFVYQLLNPKLQQKKIANARDQLRVQLALKAFQSSLRQLNERDDADGTSPLLGDTEAPEEELRPELVRHYGLKWRAKAKAKAKAKVKQSGSINKTESEDEDEDEEEEAEGGANVDKKKVILESLFWLCLGTGVVSFFSDPMVDVITDFGKKINVGAFFVSFIITPFCSNASELISSLIFASKMKKKNSSLTYSALYGAATMNNTMVLGIFYALIFFRRLAWTFSAEVVAILFTTVLVSVIALLRRTLHVYWGFIVLGFYPLSIFLVWVLEYAADWT